MNAVLMSGLTADPIDKTLQVLVAALLFRATPADFIAMVRGTPAADMTPNGAVIFAAVTIAAAMAANLRGLALVVRRSSAAFAAIEIRGGDGDGVAARGLI